MIIILTADSADATALLLLLLLSNFVSSIELLLYIPSAKIPPQCPKSIFLAPTLPKPLSSKASPRPQAFFLG